MVATGETRTAARAIQQVRREKALQAAIAAEEEARATPPTSDESKDTVQIGHRSKVIFADNLDPFRGLPSMPDEGVALTFTSPPYWNFVDYEHAGVGYEDSYQDYIASLAKVFAMMFQKTMPAGRAVVNVSNMKSRQDVEGRAFVYPIVADTIRTMMEAGFTFFDEIIWHKGSANAGALDGSPLWGSYPYPPTPKILDSTFENILVFIKPGQRSVDLGAKEQSRLTLDEWRQYTRGVWALAHDRDPNHPATFPMEVAERVVRMYSFVGDTVLDPFAGSGTAVIAAEMNGRAGIGYEISTAYEKAVVEKEAKWLQTTD